MLAGIAKQLIVQDRLKQLLRLGFGVAGFWFGHPFSTTYKGFFGVSAERRRNKKSYKSPNPVRWTRKEAALGKKR